MSNSLQRVENMLSHVIYIYLHPFFTKNKINMLRINSSNKTVPLKQIRISTKLCSFAADVTLTQIFKNDESVPVEAVYW